MKFEFGESKYSGWINLIPETPEETAKLARLAMNAKSKPVDITMHFIDTPNAEIYIQKVDESVQRNSINPKNRKQ